MASGYELARRYRRLGHAVIATTLLGGLALAAVSQKLAGDRALEAVRASAGETLALQQETLTGILEKYRLLPPLLSRRADIVSVFERPWAGDNRSTARDKAIEIAGFSGAKDVAFADAEGRIFASARGIFDNSSVHESTLFEAANQGRLGRETMALNENERAYVFASAVRLDNQSKGVIAVYVRFDQIEATWSLSTNPIVVTGADDVVFLGNREDWQLRRLKSGADPILLPVNVTGGVYDLPGGGRVVEASRHLPLLNWTMHVLADHRPVDMARRNAIIIALLAAALAGIVAWFLIQRRAALEQRLRRDRASALRLERLVRDRTAELSASNISLEREVEVRAEAEAQLRRTQSELIQAAKLAALGQMSATLSHEYNQPLAAIRTYADNAGQLLQRGQPQAAQDTLRRISGLVDRMSELSRTLLAFARKPGTTVYDVQLGPVVGEALMLVGPRAKKAGVTIRRGDLDGSLTVRAGRVRLTQVVVNLVNNAIDALSGIGSDKATREPEIIIGAERDGTTTRLIVEDNGPGIAEARFDQVFEPFYSTKGVGEGIGIGLSIVYGIVRDFGGTIDAGVSRNGGARFVVNLVSAAADGKKLIEEAGE